MTITKLEFVNLQSSTAEGSGSLQYNIATTRQNGNITLKWLGGTLTFATVASYNDFLVNVIIPLTNIINSPSGTGSGYVAMVPGVAGSDTVNNTQVS